MKRLTEQDLDDTARLILMEMDGKRRDVIDFRNRIREELEDNITTLEIAKLWEKYMGLGLHNATHNYETGERL